MKYNKLIRDKIPERIKSKGKVPITHLASTEEYWKKLKEKLKEEVNEFLEESTIEELADILEVVYAIKDFKFREEDLETIREKKEEERGAFKEKIILDEVKDTKGKT
ncbi:MAG: nucleoside triphosphate pyrophosphohydrolase [Nanoarchaeota archaeon]|nr:nucleoside triphosphate pyrophosphohydrolase [Nanoarchaeota archaeon]